MLGFFADGLIVEFLVTTFKKKIPSKDTLRSKIGLMVEKLFKFNI